MPTPREIDNFERGRKLFNSWRNSKNKKLYESGRANQLISYYLRKANPEELIRLEYEPGKPTPFDPQRLYGTGVYKPVNVSPRGRLNRADRLDDFFTAGPRDTVAEMEAFEDRNLKANKEYSARLDDVRGARREQGLIRAYQRKAGYFTGDPRLSLRSSFGIIEGFENYIMDTETTARGLGNRVFSMTFGRWQDILDPRTGKPLRKGFANYTTVYTPLELLFDEELLDSIRSASKVTPFTTAEKGRQSLEYLSEQLFTDIAHRQRQMGVREEDIAKAREAVMQGYRDLTSGRIKAFDARRGEAAMQFIDSLKAGGFDYRIWAKAGGVNIIGANVANFDRGAIIDLMKTARKSLRTAISHYSPAEGYGVNRLNQANEYMAWIEGQIKHLEGDYVQGGRWNPDTNTWQRHQGKWTIQNLRNESIYTPVFEDIISPETGKPVDFVPRAVWTNFEAFSKSNAWGTLARDRAHQLLTEIKAENKHLMIPGEDDRAFTRRLASMKGSKAEQYEKLLSLGQKSNLSNKDMAWVLGITSSGVEHTSAEDAWISGRVFEEVIGIEAFGKEFGDISIGDLVKKNAIYGMRADRIARRRFRDISTQLIRESGGIASLNYGRLSGLNITGIGYANDTRFTLRLPKVSGPKSFKPSGSPISVSRKADIITAGYKELNLIEGLNNMSPLQRAVAISEQATANFKQKLLLATMGGKQPLNVTDITRERALARYEAAMGPLEDIRSGYRGLVERYLLEEGITHADTVGKITTVLSERMWQDTVYALMASGKQTTTSAIYNVFGSPHAISGTLSYERGIRNSIFVPAGANGQPVSSSFSRYMLNDIAQDAGLDAKTRLGLRNILQKVAWGGAGNISGKGLERILPLRNPDVLDIFNSVLGNQAIAYSEIVGRDSAGQALFNITTGYEDMLSRLLAARAADASSGRRGLWSVAQALSSATDQQIDFIKSSVPSAMVNAVDELRAWGGGSRGFKKIGDVIKATDTSAALFLGPISTITSKSFNPRQFIEDVTLAPDISLSAISDVEEAIGRSTFRDVDSLVYSGMTTGMENLRNEMLADEAIFDKAIRVSLGKKADPRVFRKFLSSPGAIGFLSMIAEENERLVQLANTIQTAPGRIPSVRRAVEEIFANEAVDLGIGKWSDKGFSLGSRTEVAKTLTARELLFESYFAPASEKAIPGVTARIGTAVPDIDRLSQFGVDAVERWSGVPGAYWGLSGNVDVVATTMPSAGFVGHQGALFERGALIAPVGGGAPMPVGYSGGKWRPARYLATAESEFGYSTKAKAGDLLGGLSDIAIETATSAGEGALSRPLPTRMIQPTIQALQEAEFDDLSKAAVSLGQREAQMGATRLAAEATQAARTIGSTVDTSRRTSETLLNLVKRAPSNWKVLAAGAAGLAAITVMRKNRPLTADENSTYGGGGLAQMASPMGYMPVAPQSTYLAPPPTQGMNARISGVVGPDVNIANLQSLVGSMGFANINLNDNSNTFTQRDIDRMMSSRL